MDRSYQVVVEDAPDPRDLAFLEERMAEAAVSAAGVGDEEEFAVVVRDGGRVVAGVVGCDLGWGLPGARRVGRGVPPRSWPRPDAHGRGRGGGTATGVPSGHGSDVRRPDRRLLRPPGLPDRRVSSRTALRARPPAGTARSSPVTEPGDASRVDSVVQALHSRFGATVDLALIAALVEAEFATYSRTRWITEFVPFWSRDACERRFGSPPTPDRHQADGRFPSAPRSSSAGGPMAPMARR